MDTRNEYDLLSQWLSIDLDEADSPSEQPTEGVPNAGQYAAELGNARQRLENQDVHSVGQPASLNSRWETYHSNMDVQNAFRPLVSRVLMSQEAASSTIYPEGRVPQLPRNLQTFQGSPCNASRPLSIGNNLLGTPMEEIGPWKLSFETFARENDLGTMSSTYSQTSREASHQRTVPYALRDHADGSRFPGSYVDSPTGDESDGYHFEAGSEPEDLSALSYPNIGSSSDRFGVRTPIGHRPRLQQSVNVRGRLDPTGHRKTYRKARLVSQRPDFPSAFTSVRDRSAEPKRRRVGTPPEDFASNVTGFLAQRLRSTGIPAGRAGSSVSGSQSQSLFDRDISALTSQLVRNSDYKYAERRRAELPGGLPQPVRLRTEQHLRPHSLPPATLPNTNPPSPPPWSLLRTSQLVFTSEVIPRSFSAWKRARILDIFRSEATYIPTCIMVTASGQTVEYHIAYGAKEFPYTDAEDEDKFVAPPGPDGQGWPARKLPTELFQQIADYLPHSDMKSMRLVNREFEGHITEKTFRSAVLSFRPEIYGTIVQTTKLQKGVGVRDRLLQKFKDYNICSSKDKGKAKEAQSERISTTPDTDNGLEIFEALGSHVRRFAIAFEVTEDQMARPPLKGKFKDLRTWWGRYHWPPSEYSRFTFCHDLEQIADELRCMSAALSHLKDVRELGLCLDSGSGWLEGPDISDRAQLFRNKTKVFGLKKADIEDREKRCQEIWRGIVHSLGREDGHDYIPNQSDLQPDETPLTRNQYGLYPYALYTPQGLAPALSHPRSAVNFSTANFNSNRPLIFQGINLTNKYQWRETYPDLDGQPLLGERNTPFSTAPIVPNKLTMAQKEWLMETEWAQRAFLSSYCMALSDNSQLFKNVDSLNIAKLPSKHLSAIQRRDLWEALPNLKTLTIHVAADFRTIHKNASGVVEDTAIQPSQAAIPFYSLLKNFVGSVKSIKNMKIGYSGGGEHQTGIFGRNKVVLPAPIANYNDWNVFTDGYEGILALPFVENLTLWNCWIAPLHLKPLVKFLGGANLRSLTLDSVSLTAHSGPRDLVEPSLIEDSVMQCARSGNRRFNDSHVPGSFYSQRPLNSDPIPGRATDLWVHEASRKGSWPDVIDTITPGPTLGFVRYAFQWCEEPPELQKGGNLQVINFNSCGYVRLVNQRGFEQGCLPEVYKATPGPLYQRAVDLEPVMMHRKDDPLLGQICPNWIEMEQIAFTTGFPMTFGWGNDRTKWDNLEDAQPVGGSGRFSGRVQRLERNDEMLEPTSSQSSHYYHF